MESSKGPDKGPSNSLLTPNPEPIQCEEAGPSAKPPKPKSKNKGKQKITSLSPMKMKAKAKRQPNANGIRKTAMAWDHFTIVPGSEESIPMAACNYCGKRYFCHSKNHGTTNMNAHLKVCSKFPYSLVFDPKQSVINFQPKKGGGSDMVAASQICDVAACRKALSTFVIVDEQPFKVVEGWGFKFFCSKLQPQFHLPSRHTIARDCYQLYLDEKQKLRSFLKSNCTRICLTTDCWTSVQNLNYMVLTAHFIDNQWTLQKKILNFCQIANHRGETIGKQIESCLHEWEIESVFTVTVDNASSNDVAISYLKKRIKSTSGSGMVLDGQHMHVRCCAHVINLIVCEGLKEMHSSIGAIRNAVRWVRSSPSRLAKFKHCIDQCKIASSSLVCLDVPTRWNSTYLMLEAAQKFQLAFERLEDDEPSYVDYFDEKTIGPPSSLDWTNAKIFTKFLKIFYDCTVELSGSSYVTSNGAFPQLALIQSELMKWVVSGDFLLSGMAVEMKIKYDKYWGNVEKFNTLFYIATIVDPRYKMAYLKWSFNDIYDPLLASELLSKVRMDMYRLYGWYCELYGPKEATYQEGQSSNAVNCGPQEEKSAHKARTTAFKSHLKEKDSIEAKNEFERYLAEPCIDADDSFSVLEWWKVNSSRFPIFSMLARDVLAVPVSTVASESAFSTGGRVLDIYRSSLSPRMAEGLICAQNWLKPTIFKFDLEYLELVEDFEKIVLGYDIFLIFILNYVMLMFW